MELKRTVLVAVTVGVTALGSVGCKEKGGGEGKEGEQANQTAAAAPAPPPPAAAPAATAAATATAEDTTPVAPPAPAADQAETPGPAPSPNHVWYAGNWRYDWPTRRYEWTKGFWWDKNAFGTAAPPADVVEVEGVGPGAGYNWHPGFHYWDGHAYQWRGGYWHNGRAGFDYVHPYYENVKGHWQTQAFGWTPHAEFVAKFKNFVPHNGVFVHPEYVKVHEAFRTQHAADYKAVEKFTFKSYHPH